MPQFVGRRLSCPPRARRVMYLTLLALAALVLVAADAAAQGAIFLVRHAERADTDAGAPATMGADPELSATGHARAAALAGMLKDAGITSVFVTEYKRTQQTAAPLTKSLGLTPVTISAGDEQRLLEQLKKADGNVLVVGHSNTVPAIIEALGVSGPVTIADDEYDNLFVVTSQSPPQLIRLRYR